MAERLLTQPKVYQPGVVLVQGSFVTAGSGAPTTVQGRGYTVARTATGTYTITLGGTYYNLLAATATLQSSSLTDQFLQWGAVDTSVAKTLVLRVWDVSAAAATDVTGPIVHFTLYLKHSSSIQ
jgi:hypothetical protein